MLARLAGSRGFAQEKVLDFFLGDHFPVGLLGKAFPNRLSLVLGKRLVVPRCLIEERAERIMAPEPEVLEEAPGGDDFAFGQLVDEDMENVPVFHGSIVHG